MFLTWHLLLKNLQVVVWIHYLVSNIQHLQCIIALLVVHMYLCSYQIELECICYTACRFWMIVHVSMNSNKKTSLEFYVGIVQSCNLSACLVLVTVLIIVVASILIIVHVGLQFVNLICKRQFQNLIPGPCGDLYFHHLVYLLSKDFLGTYLCIVLAFGKFWLILMLQVVIILHFIITTTAVLYPVLVILRFVFTIYWAAVISYFCL